MAEYGEYLNLPKEEVPDHEYSKAHGDGFARNHCNACGFAKEERFHKEPEPA